MKEAKREADRCCGGEAPAAVGSRRAQGPVVHQIGVLLVRFPGVSWVRARKDSCVSYFIPSKMPCKGAFDNKIFYM